MAGVEGVAGPLGDLLAHLPRVVVLPAELGDLAGEDRPGLAAAHPAGVRQVRKSTVPASQAAPPSLVLQTAGQQAAQSHIPPQAVSPRRQPLDVRVDHVARSQLRDLGRATVLRTDCVRQHGVLPHVPLPAGRFVEQIQGRELLPPGSTLDPLRVRCRTTPPVLPVLQILRSGLIPVQAPLPQEGEEQSIDRRVRLLGALRLGGERRPAENLAQPRINPPLGRHEDRLTVTEPQRGFPLP